VNILKYIGEVSFLSSDQYLDPHHGGIIWDY